MAAPPASEELLYSLAYASRATPRMDEGQIPSLMGSCWRDNPRAHITGLLVFDGTMFVQWLEGPRDAIRALMARLADDPRHSDIVELHASEAMTRRLYPHWSMELVTPYDILGVLDDARRRAGDALQREGIDVLIQHLELPAA